MKGDVALRQGQLGRRASVPSRQPKEAGTCSLELGKACLGT